MTLTKHRISKFKLAVRLFEQGWEFIQQDKTWVRRDGLSNPANH